MKKMYKILFGLAVLMSSMSFAQMQAYDYKQELNGVTEQWHQVSLPNNVFGSTQKSLNDIRIYGITPAKDTIEAPYILNQLKTEKETQHIAFNALNKVQNAKGYYYTFKRKGNTIINQLNLEFDTHNFDWKVTVEASHNQKEWFTVVDDYRIVAIKNDMVSYQFAKVVFPKSDYSYYRVLVKTNEDPKLEKASFQFKTIQEGNLQQYAINSSSIEQDKAQQQTVAYIELDTILPINKVKVNIANTTDYYRKYTLSYRNHRFQTEKGWKENYTTIKSGVLNSVADKTISFDTKMAKKLRLVIYNQDNTPLKINSYECAGYTYALTARYDEPAKYYLTYGNSKAKAPRYDIVRFDKQIPENAKTITVGEAVTIEKVTAEKQNPLFENKMWLWTILLLIMGLLGWFSVKMMKEK